jgi:hypothetical protein
MMNCAIASVRGSIWAKAAALPDWQQPPHSKTLARGCFAGGDSGAGGAYESWVYPTLARLGPARFAGFDPLGPGLSRVVPRCPGSDFFWEEAGQAIADCGGWNREVLETREREVQQKQTKETKGQNPSGNVAFRRITADNFFFARFFEN